MNPQMLSQITVRDALRSTGGVLFAAAGLALYERKAHSWGQGGLMLTVLIPALVLYVLVLMGRAEAAEAGVVDALPWQSVLMVFALLLVPIAVLRFLGWVGATTSDSLIQALAFALSAALGILAVWLTRVRYAALLSTLFLLVVWLAVWAKIINHPSGTTERWLLFAFAFVFFGIAFLLASRALREATDVVTGAGIAAVACGFIGVIGGLVSRFSSAAGSVVGPSQVFGTSGVRQHFIWDLFLLAVSVVLIWYGARSHVRGPGYVGALGLLLFVVSVGVQVSAIQNGSPPSHSFVGWPLALLLVGVAALAAGTAAARIGGPGGVSGSTAEGAPPPMGGPAPPAASPPAGG